MWSQPGELGIVPGLHRNERAKKEPTESALLLGPGTPSYLVVHSNAWYPTGDVKRADSAPSEIACNGKAIDL